MRKYKEPELNVTEFTSDSIITLSGNGVDSSWVDELDASEWDN